MLGPPASGLHLTLPYCQPTPPFRETGLFTVTLSDTWVPTPAPLFGSSPQSYCLLLIYWRTTFSSRPSESPTVSAESSIALAQDHKFGPRSSFGEHQVKLFWNTNICSRSGVKRMLAKMDELWPFLAIREGAVFSLLSENISVTRAGVKSGP